MAKTNVLLTHQAYSTMPRSSTAPTMALMSSVLVLSMMKEEAKVLLMPQVTWVTL